MKEIISDLALIEPSLLIKWGEEKAQELKRVKTHQLRNVFAAISKMRADYKGYKREKAKDLRATDRGQNPSQYSSDQAFNVAVGEAVYSELKMELMMLKPKLAYAAGRQREIRSNFYDFMVKAINGVENSSNKGQALEYFFALMESVVAYHKFYEKA